MKKIFPLILILILLSGCKAKIYTPEIPDAFECNARVVSGDFSYDCKICKNKDSVSITVLSTSAKNLVMTFDGVNLMFSYQDFDYSIDGNAFENKNPAIVLYQAINYISIVEPLNAKKIETGYKYQGKIDLGDFVLIQNQDNTFDSLTIKNADFTVEFIN